MGFEPTRAAGLKRLAEFLPRAGRAYANNRNYDDGTPAEAMRRNVSQLSPWLHAGLVKESEVLDAVLRQHSAETADKFIAEVFWRVYFKGYLEQRPGIWAAYCAGRDSALAALQANAGLRTGYEAATSGTTGIAAFDHWVRELIDTGYLHNHARMWFASIWIFTLRLDWHLGADLFLRHLVDGDAASNTLSWRWIGGLHTKGKTYLARPDNIARYTANQPGGPLAANGLANEAPALEEHTEHPRQRLDLPPAPRPDTFVRPYALLLHDEGASHVPLHLPSPPALVIGAALPQERSPLANGDAATRFAREAVFGGVREAAAAFSCPSHDWQPDQPLEAILAEAGVELIALPYLPTGWTRDALMPQIAPLADQGRVITLLPELDRQSWPHARAGFFGVKKQVGSILDDLGISATPTLFATE